MRRLALAALFVASSLSAQELRLDRASRAVDLGWGYSGSKVDIPYPHRAGMCVLNMGQLTHEDSAFVRSGNSGWDYGCLWVELDVSRPGGFYAGMTFAASRLFVWAKCEPEISRWSWRPGCHDPATGEKQRHQEHVFFWVMPELGYIVRRRAFLEIRVMAGWIWPVQTGYAWGAPVGLIPFGGLDLAQQAGPFNVSVKGMVAYKGARRWTVLEDWSTPNVDGNWTPHSHVLTPVEVKIGVSF